MKDKNNVALFHDEEAVAISLMTLLAMTKKSMTNWFCGKLSGHY